MPWPTCTADAIGAQLTPLINSVGHTSNIHLGYRLMRLVTVRTLSPS